MRRVIAVVFGSAALAATFSAGSIAAPRPAATNSVTIATSHATVVYGSATTVTGTVAGKKAGGSTVELQAEPFGSTSFSTVATTTADAAGHYSLRFIPTVNTTLRAVAKTAPPATSGVVHVNVRVSVTLSVSSRTPAVGQKVRFSGAVNPGYPGRSVAIQRRTTTGSWRTVSHATLAAATGGRATFSKRLKITRTGTYRVRFVPPPGRLANNSPSRVLTVR